MTLRVVETLHNPDRISSVDIFRGIAIVAVVLFHYNELLPLGSSGVDLFFVISGLLVGGLLTKEFTQNKNISFFRFFLQRGFKIWPSYYAFFLFGSILVYLLYHDNHPDQVIPFYDLKRYLLFYQNYTGAPYHWSFDHVWSLCVEEHFYILLPLLFLTVQWFFKGNHQVKALFIFVILTILAGIAFKFCSYYLTNGKDTYAGTHNRIDALAWGVLLNLLLTYAGEKIKNKKFSAIAFVSGSLIFIAAVYFAIRFDRTLYFHIYFHSILPFAFFLMLMGAYHVDFSRWKVLRFIAYYSYNWYLWHPVFAIFFTEHFGNTFTGVLLYLVVSFLMAMLATVCIEEYFLGKRKTVLSKLFSSR
ncbi:MAG: hypothetical protein JWO58_1678 [Chitinophagaceae bacterium]|nr:hypothetical protein [Chitinophagaceae bacterium]